MTEEQVRAIFTVARLRAEKLWQLTNRYWPDSYLKERAESPWWLVRTRIGLIVIGWRKRVINIDWSDTEVRGIVTSDDVTKDSTHVHAWDESKAVEYLRSLYQLWEAKCIRHGVNCTKEEHTRDGGYLHDEEDDTPFDVDGIKYCGRCHTVIYEAQPKA